MKLNKRILHASLAAALACGVSAIGGQTAQADDFDVRSTRAVDTADVNEYWTAERMQNAESADALVEGKTGSSDVEIGTRHSRAGEAPDPQLNATPQSPQNTIGKVFFTLNGEDWVCSGNSIQSDNGSVVSTAGHCVNEGPGEFATNWIFVPAYENGHAPYGQWSAEKLYTASDWAEYGDITFDVGFAVMAPNDQGDRLADVVGATGWEFNAPRGQSYDALGYPAEIPFDGETLHSCSGTATDDPRHPGATQGIPCDMTGGSSGGPWFLSGTDKQNSVNSYGYPGMETMFGPYWGDTAYEIYSEANGSGSAW